MMTTFPETSLITLSLRLISVKLLRKTIEVDYSNAQKHCESDSENDE